ncbi:MAG: septal ring lytic transglycosylase RlpA family protein [Rhizobium sp.]|nr:septal ring lytic transglycosylase RlpA family protein [Rhizobium sp.]
MKDIGGATLFGGAKWFALTVLCASLASCSTTGGKSETKNKRSKEYFAESDYGVKASPRLVKSGPVPKGGGRYMVGKPYSVKGKVYVPKDNPAYDKTGIASWYGSAFHGRQTANGELYDQHHLSAAHPTLPLPSYARVTNLSNGSSVVVRVNDRGPFHAGRIIDLSNKTADLLDMQHSGTGKVRVQYIGPARMDGHDMPYLMASYVKKGDRSPAVSPEGQIASGVMVASADNSVMPINPSHSAPTMTSLAGPTPSAPYPAGAAASVTDAFDALVMLPDFGPMPTERPLDGHYLRLPGSSAASAYAAEATTAPSTLAFAAVMVRNDGLTEASILSSVARGATRLSARR